MLPLHCRTIIIPESFSTMQYHCLSLAKMEERGGGGAMTKGFVKGFQGNGDLCFHWHVVAKMLLHIWTHREVIHRSAE